MTEPVLLVGAGPAGLATAAALAREGVAFDWIDRHGVAGGAYRTMYPGLELVSPVRYSALPGLALDVPGEYIQAGAYAAYLARFAEQLGRVPARTELSELVPVGGALHASAGGVELGRYQAAVIATGMFDWPREITVPGLRASPALQVLHAHDWRGPAALAGARALVVGGGMSGVEIAEEIAHAGGPVVTLSARHRVRAIGQRFLGREFHDWAVLLEHVPVPRWTKLCRGEARPPAVDRGFRSLVKAGRIEVRRALVGMDGQRARFADGAEHEVDAVVLATGYRHLAPFLPATIARQPNGMPKLRRGRSASCAAIHFVGMPCNSGADSPYLRGVGADAARTARRLAGRSS